MRLVVFVVLLIVAKVDIWSQSTSPFLKPAYKEYNNLQQVRKEALMLQKDWVSKNQNADENLVFGYWMLEHVATKDGVTSHWDEEGHWIKFYADYTYQIGIMDDIVALGTYLYDRQRLFLLIIDSDTSREPKAYRLGMEGIDASLIGRDFLGVNHGEQIKLLGVGKQPTVTK